jgi:Fe-S cluster assembly ATP-binding protein
MAVLQIKDLSVSAGGKPILNGVDLTVKSGETHALMGPNGNGKSTLLSTVMGHPDYTVTRGSITLDGKDVLAMSVDERSRAGLFLAMQYPMSVPGVTVSDFMKAAVNAHRDQPVRLFDFIRELDKDIQDVGMDPAMAHRFVNEGFSGGEMKRSEIIQMKLLKPAFAMLDELDSGLDVDAMRVVADNIQNLKEQTGLGMIVVSHYERFYDLIHPDFVHVMVQGRIVENGGADLAKKIDEEGYQWLLDKYHLEAAREPVEKPVSLGTCAVNLNRRKAESGQ